MAGVFRHRFRLPGRPNPLGILTASAAGGGQTLTPSLFTNSNTFYVPTVSGTYTLSPGLYTDSDTFYSPTVSTSYSITPGLYTDPDTFYSPAVSATYTLTPGLYDDGDTFYTHVVSLGGSQTLVPGLYVDSDTFYSPTVSSTYTLTPALYADPDTFYSATISSTYVIAPTLYVDPDTFYAATVGSFGGPQTLLPSLYVDPDTFYVHTITGGLGSGVGQRTRYITVEFYDGGDVWRTNIARDILEYSAQPSKIAFSYVSPQDSISYASGTDKIHYTRGQVMGSIQRRSAFKKVFVAPPPAPPPTYDEVVSADSPVARWKLDELTGTTANDSIGTNHGTYAGATLNQAPLINAGTAVLFSGSNSGITIPDAAALDLSTAFTLRAWVKTSSAATRTLYDKGQSGSTWPSYWLRILAGGTVSCEVRSGNSDTPKVVATTTTAVNDGARHMIDAVFVGSSALKIYIDGVERASVSHSIASAWNTATALYIGTRFGGGEAYAGVLDELALFATALSESRIITHYNAGI